MGQCCSKRPDVEQNEPHIEKPTQLKIVSTIEVSTPQVPFDNYESYQHNKDGVDISSLSPRNNNRSPTSSPLKERDDSSITSSKYIYTSPPSSPSKSCQEPETDEAESVRYDPTEQRNDSPTYTQEIYIRPEDRPIESLFIREERKRLAQIQEQLRLEREAAHEKWVQELKEKKKEFLPETTLQDFSPRVN